MRFGLVGINHKQADLKLREQLAITCQRRFGPDRSAHPDQTFVLLSTCNRTEIYFSSENLAETQTYILNILRNDLNGQFDQKLYSYFNDDCFYHLAKVTSGLDSAIIFETEIQGQVKNAYEKACEYASLPSDMHFLFQKSLRVGKKMRCSMPIEKGIPDIEHAIYSTGQHHFRCVGNPRILFVGASKINLKILHYLKKRDLNDITLCNRTSRTSELLSYKYDLKVVQWGYLSNWILYDWIILGTKSPHLLIKKDDLKNCHTKKLLIDLSVPRNVDPELRKNPLITLLNIDQINRLLKIRKKVILDLIASKELFVEHSASQFISLYKKKQMRNHNISRQMA